MPRKTLHVENAHSKKMEVYEGVLVEDLLKKAGVPQGDQLRGPGHGNVRSGRGCRQLSRRFLPC
jgi:hypothetical protein